MERRRPSIIVGLFGIVALAGCGAAGADDPELVVDTASSTQGLTASMLFDGERVSVRAADTGAADTGVDGPASPANGVDGATTADHRRMHVITVQGESGVVYARWQTSVLPSDAASEPATPMGELGGRPFGDPDHAEEESSTATWSPVVRSHTGDVLEALSRARVRGATPGEAGQDLATVHEMYAFLRNLAGAPTSEGTSDESTGTTSQALGNQKLLNGHIGKYYNEHQGRWHFTAGADGLRWAKACVTIYQGNQSDHRFHSNWVYPRECSYFGYDSSWHQASDNVIKASDSHCARAYLWTRVNGRVITRWTDTACVD